MWLAKLSNMAMCAVCELSSVALCILKEWILRYTQVLHFVLQHCALYKNKVMHCVCVVTVCYGVLYRNAIGFA
jgi:hypothetical protein